MELKKIPAYGATQPIITETDNEKFERAVQAYVQHDYSTAFHLFKQLAKQGDAESQFLIGLMYDEGLGVAQSDKHAIYWYEKSAEQEYAYAQINIGAMYLKGQGVAQNDKQAVYWFEKAAEQGSAEAQFNLGVMYINAQNYERAAYWNEKAAEQGYTKAQFNLGMMYLNGDGVKQNSTTAKEWFSKACDNGSQAACEQYQLLSEQGYTFYRLKISSLFRTFFCKIDRLCNELSNNIPITGKLLYYYFSVLLFLLFCYFMS